MFSISSYNVAEGGEEIFYPSHIQDTIDKGNPDILCVQEDFGITGFPYSIQLPSVPGVYKNTIYSHYPLLDANIAPFVLCMVNNEIIAIANVHFNDVPYQPFQYHGIPYGGFGKLDCDTHQQCQRELYEHALNSRGHELQFLLHQLGKVRYYTKHIIITGDFNEPSSHDCMFSFPCVETLEQQGFHDLMLPFDHRKTWNHPLYPERIDFILGCNVVGINGAVGESWPSDHCMLSCTVHL